MGATVAAAAMIRREKDIVDRFRALGASSPDSARTTAQLQVEQGIAWRRLLDHAVVRSTSGGMYYLDEPSWRAITRLRRRLAVIFLAIAIVLGLTAFLAGTWGAHR
jgi:hypothetical protein